ncbi:hypothetical protein SCHPADRAFT_889238 [Schizopora paradoxa]|uniref:MARVEL domain-containing protein n=1 Tax=Schizopora paradoxa TaxID=27342 RepID=A0A0H2RR66_9AGAM|nr:hypothetical protein SCHPADRAFT_889238 [Schizopora paradoxa]
MRKARMRIQYHPLFFLLMGLVAMAELGLTAFLINQGNDSKSWPSPRYHHLLLFACFNSVWTTIFATSYILWVLDGAVHILANVASSVAWLIVNTVLWAVATALFHHTRQGGDCAGLPVISRFVSDRLPLPPSELNTSVRIRSCRQTLTVEALGWTELGLSALTMLATCLWIRMSRRRRSIIVSDSRRFV